MDVVSDPFDKIRILAHTKLQDCENFLHAKSKLMSSTTPKDILERNKLEQKAETELQTADKYLSDLEVELKAQKRKSNRYKNLEQKGEILNLLRERYTMLRNRIDGVEVEEKVIEDNRTNIEKLDDLLKQRSNNQQPDREIYQEEQEAIEKWEQRKKEQDAELEDIHIEMKKLKNEAKIAGNQLKNIDKAINKVDKHADKTQTKLESQNKKLKDLLKKIRKGDRFCVDFLLLLLLLGLIAVLYRIIKKKF